MSLRSSAVAGQFYPAGCEEVKGYLARFEKVLQDNGFESSAVAVTPQMIIVPHAGYVYSGFTADVAFKTAREKRSETQTVVVIGPSHRVYLEGASVARYEAYETPCGTLAVDTALSERLYGQFDFVGFMPEAHREHSTEVQMPFVKHYFPEAAVVEIVYGDVAPSQLTELIDAVLKDARALVVISTDLSHFHTLSEAKGLDTLCMQGVADLDLAGLESGCEACGLLGVKAAVYAANKRGLKSVLLDYRTSADVTKDEGSVVGYLSAVIG